MSVSPTITIGYLAVLDIAVRESTESAKASA